MKLKKHITHDDLIAAGFYIIDKEYERDRQDCTLEDYDYAMNLGLSRRGQCYYLLVKNLVLSLYASEPDGSGGPILFPEEIFKIRHLLDE